MIDVGSQLILCDLPVRLDTYSGCSHACQYCFVKRKYDIEKIEADNCIKSVEKFCKGERTKKTSWIDWNIPLHFGGVSDPLQPIEKLHRVTERVMEVLNAYSYPTVLSTKGELLADEKYWRLMESGNYVLQISHVSPRFDRIERGAPCYSRRLDMMSEISKSVKRLIVRIQPYIPEVFEDVLKAIPLYKRAGVYGVIVEGMKYRNLRPRTVKFYGDCVYPLGVLKPHFLAIRRVCHAEGLKFFSGENRLRSMGDSLNCCGSDGVPGFVSNKCNLNHWKFGKDFKFQVSHEIEGSGSAFRALIQSSPLIKVSDNSTYRKMMECVLKSNFIGVIR